VILQYETAIILAAAERASSIGAVADQALFKVASTSLLEEGRQMQFFLTLSNGGPSLLPSAAAITDHLPTGFQHVTSTGNGSYNAASEQWTVAPGASGSTDSLTTTVKANAAGHYTSTAMAVINGLFTLDLGANS
jgi:hypothetical protein